ncbi:PHD finger protein At1g33420-like [Telopea speciosissima]|uniref:PHD finger protein At1g33420-like n=1 Tax=Telopea speciosissima TaxID=54955 RepID=UPI001CC6D94D|nr:PHD finger protein At1g33420-like [Telopea speciosissima]
MVVDGRPLKRIKRRVTADLYDFLNFPAYSKDEPSSGVNHPDGPFRLNVRSFLSKHAQLPPPSSLFPHLLTWQILFRIGELVEGPDSSPTVVALDVVEEDVTRSRSVYCDQCRVGGWSGHPVCGKRYHFIIRADNNSIDGYHKPCTSCGDLVHLSDPRCKSCNYVMTAEDLEDWIYLQLEDTTHLLHGVVHSNGYGHLLRVNGREGGSKFLSGCDILGFWDRLCGTLGVRKVSVIDVSKKYGLEYRVLHAITNGLPWYGNWGFEFGAGSFALTVDTYRKAVDSLSHMPLNLFLSQARKPRTRLQDVISFYQAMSESELITTRDLFRFLMKLIHDAHKQGVLGRTCRKNESSNSTVLCSWTVDDIDRVEQAMIKVLRAVGAWSGSRWVSWRALRGAVTKVGSPELLDYCLKEIGGKLTSDGMAVCTRCNPDTDAIEYRLEPARVVENIHGDSTSLSSNCLSEDHLLRDLKFLFDSLLHPQTMVNYRPQYARELALSSAAKLLDSKQFVKDYAKCDHKDASVNPFAIRLSCVVELLDHPKDYTAPPPELIVLPLNATVADLKVEATKAFQEAYVLFRRFQAEELLDYGFVDDSTHVKFLVGLSGSVRVRGKCLGNHGLRRFRMERGIENWTVDCTCGAKDDDGERMLACDACGVWQHTRCAGIDDFAVVPARFVCGKCEVNHCTTSPTSEGGRQCKDESVAAANVGFENNLTMPFRVR